jgi:hypothetical protein
VKKRAGTQEAYLRLEGIRDDLVWLSRTECRAVIGVGATTFALQGDAERETLVAGFASFLNALGFPIQILVRVLPLDPAPILAELERRAAGELTPGLAELAQEHAMFLRRLARSQTLLERRYYLVVPGHVAPDARRGRPELGARRDERPAVDESLVRRELALRCDEASRQLGRCGLMSRRLKSAELAEVLYSCWCPDLARRERIRGEIVEYESLQVTRKAPVRTDVGANAGDHGRDGAAEVSR